MKKEWLSKYDQRVPRYTSYPTAPLFSSDITSLNYEGYLKGVKANTPLSLYFHIPFCDSLCWFCGCSTKIIKRYSPVDYFLPYLKDEIRMVAETFGEKRPVGHIHFGGGSPTILNARDLKALGELIHQKFTLKEGAEFAVEIDPRDLPEENIQALADIGVTRASIGLQDVNEKVQRAINRVQTVEETRKCVTSLRKHGINRINIDLIYGLPYQTVDCVKESVRATVSLGASRIVLFGYAHVPNMKKHQRLIPQEALPNPKERVKQAQAAEELLKQEGYIKIGLDHFALPDDPMAKSYLAGNLHRNFQGYTTDESEALIGFGPSAIGSLPNAYVQNDPAIRNYCRAIEKGEFATHKGIKLSKDDVIRKKIIERLMCDHRVNLRGVCAEFGKDLTYFSNEIAGLQEFIRDKIITFDEGVITMTHEGEALVRCVAALFDQYFRPTDSKYSKAI